MCFCGHSYREHALGGGECLDPECACPLFETVPPPDPFILAEVF